MLIAAWQEWTANDVLDNWIDNRARTHSVTAMALDSDSRYIDLDHSKTRFFAFDGQHRLMAIKGLAELVDNEKLHAKDKTSKPKDKGGMSLAELEMPRATLQSLLDEKIGVEIMPSVMKDEAS